MRKIKLNDTTKPLVFLMVDANDHITGKTGLAPTVTISKNGGAFASPSGTVSEIGNGWYKLVPSAADVDTLGPLLLHAEATGADPADIEYQVVAYDPYDAASLGLSLIDAAVSSRATDAGVWSYATRTITGGTIDTNNDKTGYTLTAAEHTNIAQATLTESVINVEAGASDWNLCTVILAMLKSERTATSWKIYKTPGVQHATRQIQVAETPAVIKVT